MFHLKVVITTLFFINAIVVVVGVTVSMASALLCSSLQKEDIYMLNEQAKTNLVSSRQHVYVLLVPWHDNITANWSCLVVSWLTVSCLVVLVPMLARAACLTTYNQHDASIELGGGGWGWYAGGCVLCGLTRIGLLQQCGMERRSMRASKAFWPDGLVAFLQFCHPSVRSGIMGSYLRVWQALYAAHIGIEMLLRGDMTTHDLRAHWGLLVWINRVDFPYNPLLKCGYNDTLLKGYVVLDGRFILLVAAVASCSLLTLMAQVNMFLSLAKQCISSTRIWSVS